MIYNLLIAGVVSLVDYVALHVLTCLVPAFLMAGGMVTFINREAVIIHLGGQANLFKSFSLSAVGGAILAACSCTAIPVASGLFFSGAGIGVAFILLWAIPAVNVLALVYTGSILGTEMVIARVVAVLLMAYIIGSTMHYVFHRLDKNNSPSSSQDKTPLIGLHEFIVLTLLLLSLLLPNFLVQHGSYAQKTAIWFVVTAISGFYAWFKIPAEKLKQALRESWWFVRMIFPLLLLGVFLVGIIGDVLPEDWVITWVGDNSMTSVLLASAAGALTYFATLTEAPFVDTFMSMGMAKGPALTILLTGPALSLPNWMAIARVFGWKQSLIYVLVVILLGSTAGWIYGHLG